MTEVLAVIPARGGSKGVPNKNLRDVAGVSLVGRAVTGALEARLVSRVVGSTDSEAIAEEFRRHGAEVPWLRPAELAQDDTPDGPVFRHALQRLEDDEGYRPDIVVNLRPTTPLRTAQHIDEALQLLLDHPDAASVKSVCPAGEHPYKMWTVDGPILRPLLPDLHRQFGGDPDIARQRLPVVMKSNGVVDAVRVPQFIAGAHFHPGTIASYVMEPNASIDIDTEADLARAEAAFSDGGSS